MKRSGLLKWLQPGKGARAKDHFNLPAGANTQRLIHQAKVALCLAEPDRALQYLCYQVRSQGLLPPNLVAFLNEMCARHLMETDGATWRFRHRILQEWFAGEWEGEADIKSAIRSRQLM